MTDSLTNLLASADEVLPPADLAAVRHLCDLIAAPIPPLLAEAWEATDVARFDAAMGELIGPSYLLDCLGRNPEPMIDCFNRGWVLAV